MAMSAGVIPISCAIDGRMGCLVPVPRVSSLRWPSMGEGDPLGAYSGFDEGTEKGVVNDGGKRYGKPYGKGYGKRHPLRLFGN